MNQRSRLTKFLVAAAACSFGLPPIASAAEAPRPVKAQGARPMPVAQPKASKAAPKPVDIRLGAGGEMSAVVRDASGQPQAGVDVAVLHQGAEVAVAQTDGNGQFSVVGLRRGSHVVRVQGTSSPVRFWPADAAPPQAVETPVFTGGESAVQLTQAEQVYEEGEIVNGEIVEGRVYEVQQQGYRPAPRRTTPLRRLRNGMSRVFANYPILATTALIGAGIGSGIAIGSDSSPASP